MQIVCEKLNKTIKTTRILFAVLIVLFVFSFFVFSGSEVDAAFSVNFCSTSTINVTNSSATIRWYNSDVSGGIATSTFLAVRIYDDTSYSNLVWSTTTAHDYVYNPGDVGSYAIPNGTLSGGENYYWKINLNATWNGSLTVWDSGNVSNDIAESGIGAGENWFQIKNILPSYNLSQYQADEIVVANNEIIGTTTLKFVSSAMSYNPSTVIALYFEIIDNDLTFTTSLTEPASYCLAGIDTDYSTCSSKIWSATSSTGDFSATPFTATTSISGMSLNTSYKWQVLSCDDSNQCSSWVDYSGNTPNFVIGLPDPYSFTQHSNGAYMPNKGLTSNSTAYLTARATSTVDNEVVTLYYELIASSTVATSTNYAVPNVCLSGTGFDACDSKVWAATSSLGDYTTEPFIGTTTITNLYNNNEGYKWQLKSCVSAGFCSNWLPFNLEKPNFYIKEIAPSALYQFAEGAILSNDSFVSTTTVSLSAGATSSNPNTAITLYFELTADSGTATTTYSPIVNSCLFGTDYSSCGSKIWATTSPVGDYTSAAFIATSTIVDIVSDDYKWQVMSCDSNGICSDWTKFNITTPNFKIDILAPVSLAQHEDGGNLISNGTTIATSTVRLKADSRANNTSDTLRMYFELITFSASATTTGIPVVNACTSESYSACTSKVWKVTSTLGDYTLTHFSGAAVISGIPQNTEGYKWQAMTCDSGDNCSAWSDYNTSDPNIKLDTQKPSNLLQYGDTETITNGAWIATSTIKLQAGATTTNDNTAINFYFELISNSGTATTTKSPVANACMAGTDFSFCLSKVWWVSSGIGNYTSNPATATSTITGLTQNTVGYKWQVMSCTDSNICSDWTDYNAIDPNFKLDTQKPSGLYQYWDNGVLANGGWSGSSTVKLTASATTTNANTQITLYYELIDNASTATTVKAHITNACGDGTAYSSCSNKVWKMISSQDDYSSIPYTATSTITGLPQDYAGYKWQVMACNASNVCSDWTDAGADPNFKTDFTPSVLSYVYDGLSVGIDEDATNTATQLAANWSFSDAGTGAITYEYAIGSTSGGTEILSFTSVDTDTSVLKTGLSLDDGTSYYFSVRATDEVNNATTSISDGVRVDITNPVISDFSPLSNVQIKSISAYSDISYTLSEDCQSGSIVFTASTTGGTIDPQSTRTCTLLGNALSAGVHNNLNLRDATNGCVEVMSLYDEEIYDITFQVVDFAENQSNITEREGVEYDIFFWMQTEWLGTPTGASAAFPGDSLAFTDYVSKDLIAFEGGTGPFNNVLLSKEFEIFWYDNETADFEGTMDNVFATSGSIVLLKPNGAACVYNEECVIGKCFDEICQDPIFIFFSAVGVHGNINNGAPTAWCNALLTKPVGATNIHAVLSNSSYTLAGMWTYAGYDPNAKIYWHANNSFEYELAANNRTAFLTVGGIVSPTIDMNEYNTSFHTGSTDSGLADCNCSNWTSSIVDETCPYQTTYTTSLGGSGLKFGYHYCSAIRTVLCAFQF